MLEIISISKKPQLFITTQVERFSVYFQCDALVKVLLLDKGECLLSIPLPVLFLFYFSLEDVHVSPLKNRNLEPLFLLKVEV